MSGTCHPFLYRDQSFKECFNQDVKFIIYPNGYETVVDKKGLVVKYDPKNKIEGVFRLDGKYFKSYGSVWVDIDPDVYPKKLITDAEDIELSEVEGKTLLEEFDKRYESLKGTCNEISKQQLIMYLSGDLQFADTLNKSAIIE